MAMKHQSVVQIERVRECSPSLAPTPPLVLIADADPDARMLCRGAFARAGCDVVEVADGRDALANVFACRPSVVITELTLPFVDGYALCDILRRDPLTAGVPILVVTAAVDLADRAEHIGVDAVLLKPTTPEVIVSEARRLLAASRELRARSTAAREQATAQQQPVDLLTRSKSQPRTARTKAHHRFTTTSPPMPPPALSCPSCDRALKYEQSHIGGVSDRHPEQWDYFVCSSGCGTFQYRQRTRSIRRVE
jgi:CheY-like chemotaxis protein